MRQDKLVQFYKTRELNYDKETGNYTKQRPDLVFESYALATETGQSTQEFLYGTPKKDARTLRFNHPIDFDFDYLKIDSKEFKVTRYRELLRGKWSLEVVNVKD